ncbi:MAG: DUF3034 family protein [Gammaproteobacteria bacterium]|nr:DUF3034 family protein [Gammaproteobacteria bacterium]
MMKCRSLLLCLALLPGAATADDGRLLATGGITSLEGSAGGGIVPWAVISGYGSDEGNGGTAAFSYVNVGDYQVDVIGVSAGFRNRFEISYAEQRLDLGALGLALAAPDATLKNEVLGMKARLHGDLVYSPEGQFALGVQRKSLDDATIPQLLAPVDKSGTDVYLAWSKLWLGAAGGRNLLVNATLRSTSGNELGLLGHGGNSSDREILPEVSVAMFLDRKTAIGFEYRDKPDNIDAIEETAWKDVFIAWFPSKSLALTAAWVDLGTIGGLREQTGFYFSAQASF